MSGIGNIGSASTAPTSQFGAAPVSFPGVASGIDYSSIIQKYTQLTLAQSTPLQNKVTALNSAQTELLKIQDLLSKFQDTFQTLSDPATFDAFSATPSQSGIVTLSSLPKTVASPGTYTINSVALATSTQITSSLAANGSINTTVPLNQAGFQITPQNGPVAGGSTPPATLTIDGVQLSIDVNSDTLNSVVNLINTNSTLNGLGVTASINATTGALTITQSSTSQPMTIGSANDVGNLAQAFKLDTAQIVNNGGSGYTITSSGAVSGINAGSTFNQNNNAGYTTPVTSGFFTINGVKINVDSTGQNLNNIIGAINSSSAGVVASFDSANGQLVLTNTATGSQGIVLGSASDTSNFLQASGILANYQNSGTLALGANETVGQPAAIQYTDTAGNPHTVYSASNSVTNIIPGMSMQLQASTNVPFTIHVAQDSSQAETAISNFVSAYNAVIDEINTATQAPTIGSQTNTSTGQQQATQLTNGGPLFGNNDIENLRDQLISLVSGMDPTAQNSSYNSLASIGLSLDSSFSVSTPSSTDTSSSDQTSTTTQTFSGTSGRLADLDTTTFETALQSNLNSITSLFTNKNGIIGQLGGYLTQVTGLPTQLASGIAGSIPSQSLFTTITAQNSDQITSLQQQISLITDQANTQATQMSEQFSQSEALIAQYQSLQSSISSLLGKTTT
jgi:flagellar hook-associated protein 2